MPVDDLGRGLGTDALRWEEGVYSAALAGRVGQALGPDRVGFALWEGPAGPEVETFKEALARVARKRWCRWSPRTVPAARVQPALS